MKTLIALKTCVVAAVAACAFASANAEAEETPSGYSDDWVSSDDATVRRIDLADGRAYVFTDTAATNHLTFKTELKLGEVLVVGGGGSGGGCRGGGGGAGGLTHLTYDVAQRPTLAVDSVFTLKVGAGGAHIAKGSWGCGKSGEGSYLSFADTELAVGGGGGGGGFSGPYNGLDGACGGGGCNSGGKGGAGTLGGKGGDAPDNQHGGAGGGMGGDAKGETAGPGVTIDITGASVAYSNGGARGTNGATDAPDAEAGTGNGGPGGMYGGGPVWGTAGGAGGSGTVIVKLVPLAAAAGFANAEILVGADDMATVSLTVSGVGFEEGDCLSFKLLWGENADQPENEVEIGTAYGIQGLSKTFAVAFDYDKTYYAKVSAFDKNGELVKSENLPWTFTWAAAADGKASVDANWLNGHVPFKTNAVIRLDGTSVKGMTWDITDAELAGWKQQLAYKGTVTLNTTQAESGFNALCVKGDMAIEGGSMTHPNVAQGGLSLVSVDVTGNLAVGAGGVIHAMGERMSTYTTGCNTTTGSSSHGGLGRAYAGYTYRDMPLCYGSIWNPLDYGSCGRLNQGGGGGGVIKLVVGGKLTVDGLITASAPTSPFQGGSGGSVNITCGEIDGTGAWENGWGGIWAQGSQAWNDNLPSGGGRIAITLTDETATLASYSGHLSARGLGVTGLSGVYVPTRLYFSNAGSPRYGGAGTVFVREKNAAVDEGTLIVDNDATLATTDEGAITQINSTMAEERTFAKVVVRNGGRLDIEDGLTVTATALENGTEPGKLMMGAESVIRLVGDGVGDAFVIGDFELTNLELDPSVDRLVIAAGATLKITGKLHAEGSEGNLIQIVSDTPGTFANLVFAPTADQSELNYIHFENIDATAGAPVLPKHSEGVNTKGINYKTIEPGEKVFWTGASSSQWSDPANWRSEQGDERTPIPTDRIVVNVVDSGVYPVVQSEKLRYCSLTVGEGAMVTMSEFDLTLDEGVSCEGTIVSPLDAFLVIDGPNARLSGTVAVHDLKVAAGSGVTMADGAEVTVDRLYVFGTADRPVTIAAENGGVWRLTRPSAALGYGFFENATVSDCDASEGFRLYAQNATFENCQTVSVEQGIARWTGAVSSDFADAANWLVGGAVPETAPDAELTVLVDAASCPRQPVVTVAAAVKNLVLASGTLKVNAEAVVVNDVAVFKGTELTVGAQTAVGGNVAVLSGATLTANKPLSVDGDLTALSGATLTHTALPETDKKVESYRFDVTVGGDMTIEEGAVVDLNRKGFARYCGPGYPTGGGGQTAGSTYGGRSVKWGGGDISPCYGSIFAPTNCGSGNSDNNGASGSDGRWGGGAFVAKVAGRMTLDGDILATTGYKGYFSASGGSVYIRAGELVGSGDICCDGGGATSGHSGGGGRVSLVLTKKGATFDGYTGDVTAFGGAQDVSTGKKAAASCGTIYWQDGNTAEFCGRIELTNREQLYQTDHCTDLGYDGEEKALIWATLAVGRNARPELFCDLHVANLTLADNFSKLDLNGHTLRVHSAKPKHWEETEAALVKAGKLVLGEGGQIRWNAAGIAIIVK